MTNLTHFQSKTMSPCALTREAYAHARVEWLCPGCAAPRPGVGAVDVALQEPILSRFPLTFVGGCGIPVGRLDFLLQVVGAEAIDRDLYLGKVFDANGRRLDEWVTFRGKRAILVRGTTNVSYRRCEVCYQPVYFAMGSRHVAPAPPSDVGAFETNFFGLAVWRPPSPSGFPTRGVTVEQLPILERGKDGVAELDQQ